ncbi:MAG: endolytic transglycosylase MltG [Alphaproteobacteria bacterium]|nr:endolytic transglycosylase MltG [Alphaproteobacteria bacterium]
MRDASEGDTRRRRPALRREALTIAVLVFVVTGAAVWKARADLDLLWHEDGPAAAESVVVIEPGIGLSDIATRLAHAGVLRQPEIFSIVVRLDGRGQQIRAGEYAIPAGASMAELLEILLSGQTVQHRLVVPEGLTVGAIRRLLMENSDLSGDLPSPLAREGTLLPETYFYQRDDSRRDLVERMRSSMESALAELWPRRADNLPLSSPFEALVLASIVERETGRDNERALVASVFINRLRNGARLQSDPTVIYALGLHDDPASRPLTRADLETEHPYNTYRVQGLPPGPIANPGRASLEAVLNPAETDLFYFVADGDGGHRFASNLADHNDNVRKLRARQAEDAAAAEAREGLAEGDIEGAGGAVAGEGAVDDVIEEVEVEVIP